MSRNVRSSILLGVSMGVHGIAGVYFVVAWLPSAFGFLVPLGALAVSIAVQWPRWFDVGDQRRWPGRLGRRLAMLAGAALLAGIVRVLIVAAVPAYTTWADRVHRDTLMSRGLPTAEIDATVAAHRQTLLQHLRSGAVIVLAPGVFAGLVTVGAGAVLWRRRPAG
jgi:hypothetical protein